MGCDFLGRLWARGDGGICAGGCVGEYGGLGCLEFMRERGFAVAERKCISMGR